MEETCKAPDGSAKWGSSWTYPDSKNFFLFTVLALAATPLLTILVVPRLVFLTGRLVGYYLEKKTAGRKAQILELVQEDEGQFLAVGGEKDSDDWENVEGYITASANNGGKGDKEWDGIVGFFHPFW